jgi:hypothetical protein
VALPGFRFNSSLTTLTFCGWRIITFIIRNCFSGDKLVVSADATPQNVIVANKIAIRCGLPNIDANVAQNLIAPAFETIPFTNPSSCNH